MNPQCDDIAQTKGIQMKKLLLISPILLAGCMSVQSPVAPGLLFTSVKGTHGATEVPSGPGDKTGRACAHNILGLIAIGDASTAAAKRDAGITTVTTVDFDSTTVLGIYGGSCTVVSGR